MNRKDTHQLPITSGGEVEVGMQEENGGFTSSDNTLFLTQLKQKTKNLKQIVWHHVKIFLR